MYLHKQKVMEKKTDISQSPRINNSAIKSNTITHYTRLSDLEDKLTYFLPQIYL